MTCIPAQTLVSAQSKKNHLLFCLFYLCCIKLFEAHVSFSLQCLIYKSDQSAQSVPLLHQKCFLILQSSLFFISWILHDLSNLFQRKVKLPEKQNLL